MKAICTCSFQRHGGIARKGETISLTPSEAADKFVMSCVKPVEDAAPPSAQPYLGNGVPVDPKPPPAAAAKEFDPDAATADELRAKLDELGIAYAKSQTKGELRALYAKVMEAIAGSPAETKPKEE